ncbi:MAG: hypothetical protein IJY12_01205 [Clostridia bacterium]|nr:hypothetical protein [Clostridia bacterium]
MRIPIKPTIASIQRSIKYFTIFPKTFILDLLTVVRAFFGQRSKYTSIITESKKRIKKFRKNLDKDGKYQYNIKL